MCLTIPVRILKINKNKAKVRQGRKFQEIDTSLLGRLKIGDYVLTQSGFAVRKISEREASTILNLFKTKTNRL